MQRNENKDAAANTNPKERRRFPRVPLDEPCFITLELTGVEELKVMLQNLSCNGANVSLPPKRGEMGMPSDAHIRLKDFPEGFELLNQLKGKVAWSQDGQCGVIFDGPLDMDDDELKDLLDSLKCY